MVEEAWLGRDAATLEVVIKAAFPLMQGQLEGLEVPTKQAIVPSQVAGSSQPSVAVAVQPLVVVAT